MEYKLFANCLPVKGAERSIICDVQRNQYHFIPNFLCELLLNNEVLDFEHIKQNIDVGSAGIIDEYLDFLIGEEYLFADDHLHLFPSMSLSWDWPFPVSNAIVHFKEDNEYSEQALIGQLDKLGVQQLEVRIVAVKTEEYLEYITALFEVTNVNAIILFINNQYGFEKSFLKKLAINQKRIAQLVLYNNSEEEYGYRIHETNASVSFIDRKDITAIHCGKFEAAYFSTYLLHFTESQQHNTCLNRKISIDINGEIKNCPGMAKSYGNIRDTTLAEAIETPGFKDVWYIQKDQIAVCKDCEFRHICTDCRAYIENPEDQYSKPLKCGYNPYTCEWEEWSTNPLKQKAIDYYGMQELIKQ